MVIAKILLGTALVGGVVIMQDGVVSVNVREKQPGGHHIWFAAPAAIVPFSLKISPVARDLRREMHDTEKWMPVAQAVIDSLEKSPDAVFVEVESEENHVRVQKSWGRLLIDVDAPEAEVHIGVPVRAMRHTLSVLEELQQEP